jgi:hypothetical protein
MMVRMRYWLVILMIVFTPLRGLAADMMAVSMAAQQGAAMHHAGDATPVAAEPALHADCAEHTPRAADAAAAMSATHDDSDGGIDDSCPTCASCMVCSSSALAMHNLVPAALPLHHGLPVPRLTSFSSAAPLPGFKPPIS